MASHSVQESDRYGLIMRLSASDPSSYAEPEEITLKHVDLDWTIKFEEKIIKAVAFLKFSVLAATVNQIVLDVRDIKIKSIRIQTPTVTLPVEYTVSDTVEDIGSKLTIYLPFQVKIRVDLLISYETSPEATGLTWTPAEDTCGKKFPFLYSQCQPHHARTILPCQDTPAVKFTYTAVLRYPAGFTGLMSAIRTKWQDGHSKFQQSLPIPSYLLAIVVGRLLSKRIGPRSRVWAEKEQIAEAANNLSYTESFLKAGEEICGPYLWKQYDIVLVGPKFKYGGMENPCLTFIAPPITLELPLEKVIAHEIAHSWAGNLVSCRNHEHLWINEGITSFIEGKILAKTKGVDFSDELALTGVESMKVEFQHSLKDSVGLTKLITDLTDISADKAFNITTPFYKGLMFLRYIEEKLGGDEIFLPFLKEYFIKNKFKSIVSEEFLRQLFDYFSDNKARDVLMEVHWNEWLHGEGMPPAMPKLSTAMSDIAKAHSELWIEQTTAVALQSPLLQQTLTPAQTFAFLKAMLNVPEDKIVDFNLSKITAIVDAYKLTNFKDVDIDFKLMILYLRAHLPEKFEEILKYAGSHFRLDFASRIYEEFMDWPEVRPKAIEHFESIKSSLLSYVVEQIEEINKMEWAD